MVAATQKALYFQQQYWHIPHKKSAERVGFEPTEPYGSRALQARALGQTMRPLLNAG